MEEAAKLAVPWDTTFAVSQDVDGCHIPSNAVGRRNMSQEVGVIVVRDSARVVDTKRVESVAEGGFGVDCVLGFLEGESLDGHCFGVGAGCCVEEGDVVFNTLV